MLTFSFIGDAVSRSNVGALLAAWLCSCVVTPSAYNAERSFLEVISGLRTSTSGDFGLVPLSTLLCFVIWISVFLIGYCDDRFGFFRAEASPRFEPGEFFLALWKLASKLVWSNRYKVPMNSGGDLAPVGVYSFDADSLASLIRIVVSATRIADIPRVGLSGILEVVIWIRRILAASYLGSIAWRGDCLK
jgi:hypothetical protein